MHVIFIVEVFTVNIPWMLCQITFHPMSCVNSYFWNSKQKGVYLVFISFLLSHFYFFDSSLLFLF